MASSIKAYPLVDYEIGTLPDVAVFLSLRIATEYRRPATEEEKTRLSKWLPVTLSADQADALAEDLRKKSKESRERENSLRQ